MTIQQAGALTIPQSANRHDAKKEANQAGESFQNVLAQATAEDRKLTDAARQFEGLIAGQVLKSAREASDGGWLGADGDQTGELALEMAEQGLAQALAARGGLGISKSVIANLHRNPVKDSSSAPAEAR